jgi:hypothetical protein
MNAVEIEQAITDLAEQPFDPAEFPYAFLEAFGNKATTIKRLRAGASNKSDLGGVLQTSNIHILTCDAGPGRRRWSRSEPGDGQGQGQVHPRHRRRGLRGRRPDQRRDRRLRLQGLSRPFRLLPAAGGHQHRPPDQRKRLRHPGHQPPEPALRRTVEGQPEWGTAERRHDMNHFMARLIFCFFAEDTDIFTARASSPKPSRR